MSAPPTFTRTGHNGGTCDACGTAVRWNPLARSSHARGKRCATAAKALHAPATAMVAEGESRASCVTPIDSASSDSQLPGSEEASRILESAAQKTLTAAGDRSKGLNECSGQGVSMDGMTTTNDAPTTKNICVNEIVARREFKTKRGIFVSCSVFEDGHVLLTFGAALSQVMIHLEDVDLAGFGDMLDPIAGAE